MKKILIRGPNWIGDSVISIPVLKAVRQEYPDAYIGLVLRAGPAELLKAVPYVNKIYLEGIENASIYREKFELGLILTNSFSSAFRFWHWGVKERIGYPTEHRGLFLTKKVMFLKKPRSIHLIEEYFQILRTAGIKNIEYKPEFFIPEENTINAAEILKTTGFNKDKLIIGVCPGATYGPAKMWPKERFLGVINSLIKEKKVNVVVFSGPNEKDLINFLLKNSTYSDSIITGPCDDILTGAALMKNCCVVLSNDTGPMHLAASLGVPVVAIFGSTDPVWTGPLGEQNTVFYKSLECSPCFKRDCFLDNDKYKCLNLISETEVLEAIEASVNKRSA